MTATRNIGKEKVLYSIGHSRHPIAHFIKYIEGTHRHINFRRPFHSVQSPKSAVQSEDTCRVDWQTKGSLTSFQVRNSAPGVRVLTATSMGKVQYVLIAARPEFTAGLERIIDKTGEFKPALLCAEEDPLICHRTILILSPPAQ